MTGRQELCNNMMKQSPTLSCSDSERITNCTWGTEGEDEPRDENGRKDPDRDVNRPDERGKANVVWANLIVGIEIDNDVRQVGDQPHSGVRPIHLQVTCRWTFVSIVKSLSVKAGKEVKD